MNELDNLDRLAASSLDGYLVRKDLVRTFSRQFPVPTYVVEFLLGRYCASIDQEEIDEGLELARKMAEEDWSVERFCLGQEMRSLYKQYLWNFPVENFSFIGIMEYYDEDIRYFSDKYLGKLLASYNMNTGKRVSDYADLGQRFRKEIEVHHAEDMELYQYALEKRNYS